MKRIGLLLLAAVLAFSLVGCSKAACGKYKLEYITADGLRLAPGGFSLNITMDLQEDGVGIAYYSGSPEDITWTDEGGTVFVTGNRGVVLEFTKDGDSLVLHDEGVLLFFTPVEEED